MDTIGIQHDAYALSTQSIESITPRRAVLFLNHIEDIRSGACPNCADMRAYFTDAQLVSAREEARHIARSDR